MSFVSAGFSMIEVTCNDRLGKKVRVKCNPDDTIGDLKKLISAQTGTHWEKIVLKKWYTIFKDHIKLADCILFYASLTCRLLCYFQSHFSFLNDEFRWNPWWNEPGALLPVRNLLMSFMSNYIYLCIIIVHYDFFYNSTIMAVSLSILGTSLFLTLV